MDGKKFSFVYVGPLQSNKWKTQANSTGKIRITDHSTIFAYIIYLTWPWTIGFTDKSLFTSHTRTAVLQVTDIRLRAVCHLTRISLVLSDSLRLMSSRLSVLMNSGIGTFQRVTCRTCMHIYIDTYSNEHVPFSNIVSISFWICKRAQLHRHESDWCSAQKYLEHVHQWTCSK